MNMRNRISSLIPAGVSLLMTVGVMTAFSACGAKDDGSWMHCHDVQIVSALSGVCMAAVLLISAFLKNRTARILLNGAAIAAAAVVFLLPGTVMPMCILSTMRCYTFMQPFVRVMTIIIAVLCASGILRILREK